MLLLFLHTEPVAFWSSTSDTHTRRMKWRVERARARATTLNKFTQHVECARRPSTVRTREVYMVHVYRSHNYRYTYMLWIAVHSNWQLATTRTVPVQSSAVCKSRTRTHERTCIQLRANQLDSMKCERRKTLFIFIYCGRNHDFEQLELDAVTFSSMHTLTRCSAGRRRGYL